MFSDRSWASSRMIVSYWSRNAVALGLGQQDAVGHQLDVGLRREGLGEADLEAHVAAQGRGQLLGDPCRHAAGGDAAGLRVADQAVDPAAQLQADLRQLRRLARARLAADDHHLVVADGAADLVASGRDGQIVVVANRRHAPAARFAQTVIHAHIITATAGSGVLRPVTKSVLTTMTDVVIIRSRRL